MFVGSAVSFIAQIYTDSFSSVLVGQDFSYITGKEQKYTNHPIQFLTDLIHRRGFYSPFSLVSLRLIDYFSVLSINTLLPSQIFFNSTSSILNSSLDLILESIPIFFVYPFRYTLFNLLASDLIFDNHHYQGVTDCIQKRVAKRGLLSLWSGCLFGFLFEVSLRHLHKNFISIFGGQEVLEELKLESPNWQSQVFEELSFVLALIIAFPLQTVASVQSITGLGIREAVRTIVETNGVVGLWNGVGFILIGSVISRMPFLSYT